MGALDWVAFVVMRRSDREGPRVEAKTTETMKLRAGEAGRAIGVDVKDVNAEAVSDATLTAASVVSAFAKERDTWPVDAHITERADACNA